MEARDKSMSARQPTFESLQLIPGQPLQLELDGHKRDRDRSVLVGYRPGSAILVTTPMLKGRPVPIRLETGVNVRLFANRLNGVCAFRSKVIYMATLPFAHLHLSMPDELFIGEIRKSVRARVKLTTALIHQDERVTAELTDLSVDGGRARTSFRSFDTGHEIQVIVRLNLGRVEKVIRLNALIRSIILNKEDGQCTLGLQWVNVPANDSIALQAFVLERLNEHPY